LTEAKSAETLRRFSHSLIDTYLGCPRKAGYRYVDELPSPTGVALIKGTAMDMAANHDLKSYIETGKHAKPSEVLDAAEDGFAEAVDRAGGTEEVDWGDDPEDDAFDSTIRLTRTWRRELAPDIEPTAVQVELHHELPSGRDFIGFLDWEGSVDGREPVIGDNKTGKRKMNRDQPSKALQPYAYAWLKNEPIEFVFARSIDTGKGTNSEFCWTKRSSDDVAWYGELVTDVERAFETGIFPPNPTSFLCSERWCPYFATCQPHRSTHAGVETR